LNLAGALEELGCFSPCHVLQLGLPSERAQSSFSQWRIFLLDHISLPDSQLKERLRVLLLKRRAGAGFAYLVGAFGSLKAQTGKFEEPAVIVTKPAYFVYRPLPPRAPREARGEYFISFYWLFSEQAQQLFLNQTVRVSLGLGLRILIN
jgi:hypothetical protein